VSESRRGFFLGAAAYGMWGLFPLYWTLMRPAVPFEILAHRVFWSLLVMAALVVVLRRRRGFLAIISDRRTRYIVMVAAVAISVNWGGYIWGVNNGYVVETSLGYFINPLVTVLMGVLVIGERLRTLQWVAMGIATIAVLTLTVELGRPPWVALVVAFSFACYGLAKKKANAKAVESLALETLVTAPVALGYLLFLGSQGESTFGNAGLGHALLLVSTGLVTAVPLICFGAAATRVSMTTIGLLQYLAPTLQFALGVFLFDEAMPPARLAGYCLVWTALVIFTYETITHRRRQLRLTAEASAI
jgi:chloramphenicol-sensitive protein RarD